ncbi:hypothetical protein GBA52_018976 [Prunus armeniaca]|nr:hypothetical protein GBA52_018976 [Prunus armeniaca]
MEELIQGREVASGQLSRVINLHNSRSLTVNGDHNHDLGAGDDEGFVNKMLGSFPNTLFIANGKEMKEFHHHDDQELISDQIIQVNTSGGGGGAGASSWDVDHLLDHAIKCEASHEESYKSASTFSTDRRGSYKKRKTCHSWIKDSPALTEDGHAWRKYGQKLILNAKHPRNYFRCTHKFDQACQATKHVQQVEDDPPLFRTTYYGNHTCRGYLKASELVLDCTSPRESSKFIRFDDTNPSSKQEHPFFSSFKSLKGEERFKEETMPSDYMTTQHHNQLALSDYLVSPPDLPAFASPGLMSEFASANIAQLDEDAIYRKMAGFNYDDFAFDEFLQHELR